MPCVQIRRKSLIQGAWDFELQSLGEHIRRRRLMLAIMIVRRNMFWCECGCHLMVRAGFGYKPPIVSHEYGGLSFRGCRASKR